MNVAIAYEPPRALSREDTPARWHRRSIRRIDVVGGFILVAMALLGAYLCTGIGDVERVMYGIYVLVALPYAGPYLMSVRRYPPNLQLALLFGVLTVTTAAAFASVPASQAVLQTKALAATAVWSSIYVVVFSAVKTADDVARVTRWIQVTCTAATASVYLSVVLHAAGISFGEVLEFSDGTTRVFGPLGDQVGFILVLPALMSLAASSPVMFGVHLGALLLTATRGALLCLVVGVGLYLFVPAASWAGQSRRRVVSLSLALVVAAVVWVSPLSAVVIDRLWEEPMADGFSFRLTAIETGARIFRDNALLGVGFNGFGAARPAVYADWVDPAGAANGLSRTANQYLQTATDGGVVALLLLLLFVFCTSRNALRVAKSSAATPVLVGSQLWLVAVMVGNQGALWLLSTTACGFFVFAVAGLTARMTVMGAGHRQIRRPARTA